MSILIRDGTIVTMDGKNRIIKDGALYVEGDRIAAVGKGDDLAKAHKADKVIDASGKLIMPGLVNAHTHSVSSLVRGLGADVALLEWLKKLKLPYYAELNGDEAYHGALLSYVESIKSGSTCIIDHYYPSRNNRSNVDRIAEAIEDSGVRGTLVRAYHDENSMIPEIFIESREEILREYDRMIRKWNGGADGRIMTWTGPDNLLFSTPGTIIETHELASKYGVGIHTHLSESQQIADLVREKYGKGSVEIFHDLGILDPKFQAAHSVILSDREIDLMARTGANAVNNVITNAYLADGVAPVPKMLRAGVNVALGTDATGTYGGQDMFLAMKFAASLHKLNSSDPTAISALDVVEMATMNGAKALGLQHEIGSIETGKKADIIVIDMQRPHILPVHDPIATMVYSVTGSDVSTVIIDGNIVMGERSVKTVDEQEVLEKANAAAEKLVGRTCFFDKL